MNSQNCYDSPLSKRSRTDQNAHMLESHLIRPARWMLALMSIALLPGCFATTRSKGGAQTKADDARHIRAADIALPEGYRIEAVATGLNFPTGVAIDAQGIPYVVEAGYSYGEVFTTPRLLRVQADGATTVVASGVNGPWNGVAVHDGAFYVAEGGVQSGGKILRIDRDGKTTTLVENLPTQGDHHANGPAISADGMIYFGVGTATNSGVVGTDNADFGWLARHPDVHDIPPVDIKLTGQNFTTKNPLTPDTNDEAVTGAYVPFGTRTEKGQTIKGQMPCNGAILRMPLAGGTPELVAWGVRNPYGFAFAEDGKLFVTENSFDVRGSRPIFGTGDLVWEIEQGAWYGWPDFFGGDPLASEHYAPPGKEAPRFLLAEHPGTPPAPLAKLGVHSSTNGLDVSRSDNFGHVGELFIAQFGDMAPNVGKVEAPVGYRIVRVDPKTGIIRTFAANRGDKNGPASKLKGGGFERPNDVQFDPTGQVMYVVDFGVMTISDGKVLPRENTGVLWRITREGTR